MIPRYTFLALKWCVKLGSKYHAIPYEWHEDNKMLTTRPKHWVDYNGSEEETTNIMLHCLYGSIYITTNLFTISYIRLQKEAAMFLNSLLFYNKQYEVEPHMESRDYFGMLLLVLLVASMSNSLMFLFLFAFSPTKPYYMYSLLPSKHHNWLVMIPFALNEYAQAIHAVFASYFYVYGTLITERTLILWIQLLTLDAKPQRFRRTLAQYRCLQLLKSWHNKACRWFVVPVFYSCLMLMMIFSGYSSIRLYNKIPIYLYVTMPVLFGLLLVFCILLHGSSASVYEKSVEFIRVQRYHAHGSRRKSLVSLAPLRIYVGGTYFITNGTVVNFIHILWTTTATLLLTF